jgi:hypothetical protein
VQGRRRDQTEVERPQVMLGELGSGKVLADRLRIAHVLPCGIAFRNS